jgi:hypothetical protein
VPFSSATSDDDLDAQRRAAELSRKVIEKSSKNHFLSVLQFA